MSTNAEAATSEPEQQTEQQTEQKERAIARQQYLQALDAITSNVNLQNGVTIVLKDSDHNVSADKLVAVSSDSSRCIVKGLTTPLGKLPSAILHAADIVSLTLTVAGPAQSQQKGETR